MLYCDNVGLDLTGVFMKFLSLGLVFLSFTLCGVGNAQQTIQDSSTGELFPQEINFESKGQSIKLDATGVATRKKLIIKVYSIAHYIQDASSFSKTNFFQEVLKDGKAKQFTMKWVRNVPVDKVTEAYHDSFKNVLGGKETPKLTEEINTFISYFNQEAKKGDEYVLRWLPGGIIEVILNGKKAGSVEDVDFAKALWSIWFGENSVVNRDQLISQLK